MDFLEKSKIINIERQYNNKKTKKRLILLLNRYYLAFLTMEDIEYLKKAYSYCLEYLNKNKSDFDILLATCFFSIFLEDKENMEKFYNIVSKYKKYLKNNDEEKYCFYVFLKGLIKLKKRYNKGINKYIKALQNIDNNISNFYIIFLKIQTDNVDRDVIFEMQNIHNNSFIKNIILYSIFEKSSKFINFEKDVFNKYVKWALYNNINIEKSIFRYESNLHINNEENYFNKKLYKTYNLDFILTKICLAYMDKNIHNEYSYFFFKEAINRQIIVENITKNYIKVCYQNGMEDIGIYPIKEFLKEENNSLDIMAFIYHIIVNDKKFDSLVLDCKNNILKYGAYFLEKGLIGKYYYSIYKYMLNFVEEKSKEERKIIDILYPNNFLYEIYIEDKKAKTIVVKDYEIDTIREYKIKNNKAIMKANTPNFYYYIFTEDKKEIIKTNVKINKLIEGTNGKYIEKFYNIGYRDEYTLINITKYYLENKNLEENKIKILKDTLNIPNISLDFKMKIILNIGDANFNLHKYEEATNYYKKVLENYIDDKYINNIVKSYVKCGEYKKAINIINKKYNILDDEILFYAIKKISGKEEYNKKIVKFAYELLLRGKVDSLFIDIVLKNYKGGLNQWIELRKTLSNIGIEKKEIDEQILSMIIYTNKINKYSEKVFIKLYKEDVENKLVEYFLNYCMHVAFNETYTFCEETLHIIEYIFKETNDKLIGYTLANMYLKGDYSLENKENIFEKIIKNMEEDNINFKIFENNKDKFTKFSYLYKNKPFIYNSSPNKEVFLFYKDAKQDKFYSIKMKYFKFGMYIVTLPIFYGENIEYYFMENMEKGNITTKSFFITNDEKQIFNVEDEYFNINNAYVNFYDGKYDKVHQLIEKVILKDYNLKGKLL